MNSAVIAKGIVHALGLALIAVALFHFFGVFAVIGLIGFVLRYDRTSK